MSGHATRPRRPPTTPRDLSPPRTRSLRRLTPQPTLRTAAAPASRGGSIRPWRPATGRRATPLAEPRGEAGTSAPAGVRRRRAHRPTAPPRASSAMACSAARYRGASSSASRSRNATTSALPARCSTASVPINTSQSGDGIAVAGNHADRSAGRRLDLLAEPADTGRISDRAPEPHVLTHDRADGPGSDGTPASPHRPASLPPGTSRSAAATCTCDRPAGAPGPWCCARR